MTYSFKVFHLHGKVVRTIRIFYLTEEVEQAALLFINSMNPFCEISVPLPE